MGRTDSHFISHLIYSSTDLNPLLAGFWTSSPSFEEVTIYLRLFQSHRDDQRTNRISLKPNKGRNLSNLPRGELNSMSMNLS